MQIDRHEAYSHWVLDLPSLAPLFNYTDLFNTAVIVKGGYLLRTASIDGPLLLLTGDINETTTFEVIGAPASVTAVRFNDDPIQSKQMKNWVFIGTIAFSPATHALPNLIELTWKYIDSLP